MRGAGIASVIRYLSAFPVQNPRLSAFIGGSNSEFIAAPARIAESYSSASCDQSQASRPRRFGSTGRRLGLGGCAHFQHHPASGERHPSETAIHPTFRWPRLKRRRGAARLGKTSSVYTSMRPSMLPSGAEDRGPVSVQHRESRRRELDYILADLVGASRATTPAQVALFTAMSSRSGRAGPPDGRLPREASSPRSECCRPRRDS